MKYFIQLFSPGTHEKFSNSDRTVIGFKKNFKNRLNRIEIGDKLICYLTGLSRFCGVLEIKSKSYIDETPIFTNEFDPYIYRFRVETKIWLDKYNSIPVKEPFIWNSLTFTKDLTPLGQKWKGKFRTSLTSLILPDATTIENAIKEQELEKKYYEINAILLKRLY
jgi:hypothetical protein